MSYRSLGYYHQIEPYKRPSQSRLPNLPWKKMFLLLLASIIVGGGGYGAFLFQQRSAATKYMGRTYYVSQNGSDTNDGLTIDTAWKTIEKVNLSSFRGRDTILFEGGKTFVGTLALYEGALHETGHDAPITIGSYGTEKAVIDGKDQKGIYLVNTGNVIVEKLIIFGQTPSCQDSNDGIYLVNFGTKRISNIQVRNVEVFGFCTGISMLSQPGSVVNTILIDHVITHDNGKSGISLYGVDGAIIEKSVVYNNGGSIHCDADSDSIDPFAISAFGKNIRIQDTELFGQRSHPSCALSSGGISISGERVIVQHNYSHDNDGPALLFDKDGAVNDAVARYNISENDALTSALGILTFTGGSYIDVYNNTIYTNRTDAKRGPMIAMLDNPYNHVHLRNNIFLTEDQGQVISVNNIANVNNLLFQNNVYYDTRGKNTVKWGTQLFATVIDWAKATTQEQESGQFLLRITNPLVCGIGQGKTVYPAPLDRLKAYQLPSNSPLIDQGVDVWGMAVSSGDLRILRVTEDFWGNKVPSGVTFDIGASEYLNGQVCEI